MVFSSSEAGGFARRGSTRVLPDDRRSRDRGGVEGCYKNNEATRKEEERKEKNDARPKRLTSSRRIETRREEDRYEQIREERGERLVQQKGQRRGQRRREEEEESKKRTSGVSSSSTSSSYTSHDTSRSPSKNGGAEETWEQQVRNSSSERSTSSSFPPPLPSLKEKEEIHSFPVLNPDNDLCVHGYPSSRDARECVCNTDWTGAKCKENPVPSCDRFTYGSCGDVLIRQQIIRVDKMPEVKDFPSCKCVDECIDYMLEAFGEGGVRGDE